MQSSQSSSASSILILDLVTKFLNKVLEKDRNQSYYLKQWESFRVLLSASPLDLNPVFGHLASITPLPEPISSPGLNSKSPGLSSRSPGLSKPGLKTRPSSTTDQYALTKNRSFHVNTDRDVVTSFQVTSSDNSYDGLSYLESEVPHKRTSSNAGMAGPITITTNPVDLRRHTSHKPSTFANIGEGTSANEIKSTPFSLEDMLNGSLGTLGIPSTELKTQQPYHMGFLTSISKQLKDGIERRSDNVLKSFSRSKEAQAFIGEPRSPLRKVKVYEKQKDGASNQLDLGKLLTPNYTANYTTNYTSVNTSAGSKLDYMSRVKLY